MVLQRQLREVIVHLQKGRSEMQKTDNCTVETTKTVKYQTNLNCSTPKYICLEVDSGTINDQCK
jgi:hypothetical protein